MLIQDFLRSAVFDFNCHTQLPLIVLILAYVCLGYRRMLHIGTFHPHLSPLPDGEEASPFSLGEKVRMRGSIAFNNTYLSALRRIPAITYTEDTSQ